MSVTPYGEPTDLAPLIERPPSLREWVQDASGAHKIAQVLATTQFVPTQLRGRPDEIAALILYGNDLGMPPMIALNQIHIIEGRPSISALAMRGKAQANGVKFRYDEMTETRVRISAMAPGDTGWTTVLWTIDRAKKLGLTGKSNWSKQPQAMLVARATSEVCRLVAAPLFVGLPYSVEELTDGVTDMPVPEQPAEPKKATRTLKREPIKAAAARGAQLLREVDERAEKNLAPAATHDRWTGDSTADTEPVKVQATVPDGIDPTGPVTHNTRAALMATFRDQGFTDRDTRLGFMSMVVGREVGSGNELNEGEAREVLRQLKSTRDDHGAKAGGEAR